MLVVVHCTVLVAVVSFLEGRRVSKYVLKKKNDQKLSNLGSACRRFVFTVVPFFRGGGGQNMCLKKMIRS